MVARRREAKATLAPLLLNPNASTRNGPLLKLFAFLLASLVPQMVARSREDILAARGVKPTLSPNLSVRSMGPFRSMGFVWVVSVDVQASHQLSTRSMGPYLGCTAGQAARQLSWLSLTLLCRLWPSRLQPCACMRVVPLAVDWLGPWRGAVATLPTVQC